MTPLALDIAIGLIIFLSTLAAYFRGLIKEVFTLLGLAVAVFLAYKLGHLLVPEFNQWLHVPEEGDKTKTELVWGLMSPALASKVFSYGGTFLSALLVMILLGHFISRWIQEAGLGIVDRLLGAGFGLLRGFLLVFLFYVPSTYLIEYKKFPDWAKNSFSVPVLQSALDWTNKTFELDKKIEDRGNGIAIKFDKVDLDKIGAEAARQAEEELKAAIAKEEKEVQKGDPNEQPEKNIPAPDETGPSLP
jgi:membrane protein required for colicin V production